jgi:hypothetical protein
MGNASGEIRAEARFIFDDRTIRPASDSSAHEAEGRIRSLMVPDPSPRNGIGIKYGRVSR